MAMERSSDYLNVICSRDSETKPVEQRSPGGTTFCLKRTHPLGLMDDDVQRSFLPSILCTYGDTLEIPHWDLSTTMLASTIPTSHQLLLQLELFSPPKDPQSAFG